MKPTALEDAIVELLLRGEHPGLDILRSQWAGSEVTNRETSGVGGFVTIKVPASSPVLAAKKRFTLGDVVLDLPGREAAIGAVLFVENGVLDMLELFTFDGAWPEDTSGFKVSCTREPRVLPELAGAG